MRAATDVTTHRCIRVAAAALLALVMSSPAYAELCIDMNQRFDERELPAALVESMRREAASIWESYGVRLQWQASPGSARCTWTQASFDVLLDRRARPAGAWDGILGRTHLAPRAIDHAPIYIDLEATEELLGSMRFDQLARQGRSYVGPADVGRALGRILAHEVGHVLLAVADHQTRGLMRPAFAAEDLLSPQRGVYTLSLAEIILLRQRERALNVSGLPASSGPADAASAASATGPSSRRDRCRGA